MAKCSTPCKSDQPSIKYRRYPICQAPSGVAEFVLEKSAPTIADKSNEQGSRKTLHKSSEILSTTELISAVGQVWDCASRPLGFFQPKANPNYTVSCCREDIILSGLDGEALISDNGGSFSVGSRNYGHCPHVMQPSSKFLQVSQKLLMFEHNSKYYSHSSFWRLLHGRENISRESCKGIGLASLEVSHQLGSVYGWMSDIISSGSKCSVNVTEIENRTDQCCNAEDTISVAGGSMSRETGQCCNPRDALSVVEDSISGETTRPEDNLATNTVCNPTIVKSRNLSLDDNKNLEVNIRGSQHSDYFLIGGNTDGRISKTPNCNLYAKYHINSLTSCSGGLTSCSGGYEECHCKIEDHELIDKKMEEPEKFVIPDGCKTEICALACEKPHSSPAKQEHALAGALSGIFVSLCLHPVDTVKTVIQSCRAEQKSICYIGKSIVSDRGLIGLYRGIATNMASSAPISAVYTLTYESVKGALLPLFPKEYYSFAHCVAGGCASIATSFIFTPSEHIKQQMQVGSHYRNCWNALVGIIQKGGLRSLYAGWGAVLCRNVPHSVVKFYTYESLKQLMLSSQQSGFQLNTVQTLVCGGLAGSTAALFTTPFDVVKTRLQTQIPGSVSQYNGVIHALQEIRKIEGLKGLYRGLTPRLVMYMSQGALFFASYEFFKRSFSLEKPLPDTQRIQDQQNINEDQVHSLHICHHQLQHHQQNQDFTVFIHDT